MIGRLAKLSVFVLLFVQSAPAMSADIQAAAAISIASDACGGMGPKAHCETVPHAPMGRYFLTSDSVKLHYLEAGPQSAHTLVFVPGWTMPAWIWMQQIQAFSARYHVIAFDPRGQGASATPASGYEPIRRGRDITELLAHLNTAPVTIIAWSLGVLDTLAAIHTAGDHGIKALVLVDNSVGEEPAPPVPPPPAHPAPPVDHATYMRRFVGNMFHTKQSDDYLSRLTQASLRTPEQASKLLLAYPVPRSFWREAVYATKVPLLYMVRPRWQAQGENLLQKRPNTELEVFTGAGHALFVDDAARFNTLLSVFLTQKAWP
jgi:microsomal epoxide hydrolase